MDALRNRSALVINTFVLALILPWWPAAASAQANPSFARQSASAQIKADIGEVARNFAHDEYHIFASPVRVAQRPRNLLYLAPFVVAGALIPTDRHIEPNPSTSVQNAAQDISNVGLFGTAATVGGVYLYGIAKHDDHAHEAGLLGTESFVDT